MTITVRASTYETFLKLKQLGLTEKEMNEITETVTKASIHDESFGKNPCI